MAAPQTLAAASRRSTPHSQAEIACFHCGLPVPAGAEYAVVLDDEKHPLCCAGCEAVAQAIVNAGLTDFYRHRTDTARRANDAMPEQLRSLGVYDRPDLQRGLVRADGEYFREASLILDGIVCAACVWLNERHVGALPGVAEFRVNYATHRAHVRWDEREIRLSDILAAISAIGYNAYPFDPGRQEDARKRERASALRRVAVAALCTVQVMMLAVAMYGGDYYGMDEDLRGFLRWVSLLLTLPVILYAAHPFFSAAWRDLRRWSLGMDVPVSLAIIGAFCASAWYTWHGGGEVYYDSVTMFTFFLLGSRFLEMSARHRAAQLSEELMRLLPATATRLIERDREEVIPIAELSVGDRVLIRPGETAPADGRIVEGASSVDEALLTGESLPLAKTLGDPVIGGSVNVDSPLVIEVEKTGADTTLSAIVGLLDRAQSEKPHIALLANRVAAWFVGAVLLIAAGVAGWWWLTAPDAVFRIVLSVLVVTCPCALSLATPTALTAATVALTRIGLLTTRGHALETLARATHVVLDKTGTLTYGRLRLIAVEAVRGAPQHCLALAAALERGSEHPVAKALVEAADDVPRAVNIKNTPGMGVEGLIDGTRYRIGKPAFATGPGPDREHDPTATWIALSDDKGLLAWFRLADELRPEAADTVAGLRSLGLEVILLSGDQPETVAAIADRLGIEDATGGLSPEDKLSRIRTLQGQGAIVAMVGDGINDAPVLAAAQVSLAMGRGTQLAQATADMVLFAESLLVLTHGVKTARLTLSVIRQNIAWAVVYNVLALPLAAAGWVAPWMAALGMSLSSLLVVANASRLKHSAH